MFSKMIAMAQAMFGMGADMATLNSNPQFRKGTPQRKVRKSGKNNPAGTKQMKLVKKRKLGLKNPGGMVSEYFREKKQDRMLRIQAEYGNCAGRLH